MENKAVIELYVEMVDGERRIIEIRVFESDGRFEELIINDDRKKDITHLNKYKGGKAVVHTYFNGKIQIKGEFVSAGFNEEGFTLIQYYEDEVFN